MSIKTLSKVLSVFAFALCSSSMLSTAHAWTLKIDCHGTGGVPSWAQTTNQIRVIVTYNNWPEPTFATFNGVPASMCDGEDELVVTNGGAEPSDPSKIATVTVTTNGNNTFWIDEVRLLSGSSLFKKWGVDNTSGWCISMTPSDGTNSNCPSDAEPGHLFRP